MRRASAVGPESIHRMRQRLRLGLALKGGLAILLFPLRWIIDSSFAARNFEPNMGKRRNMLACAVCNFRFDRSRDRSLEKPKTYVHRRSTSSLPPRSLWNAPYLRSAIDTFPT